MAFQMPFTNDTGVDNPESYWRVVETNLCQADKRGRVVFYGYHTAAARLAGKAPIGSKDYSINQATYEEYFAPDELSPEGKNPVKQAYLLALATLEGRAPKQGEEDTRVSFFNGAQEV